MKRYPYAQIFALVLTTMFFSCRQQNEPINQEFGNIPAPLIENLKKIGGQIQKIEIDPTLDNTIIGQQGTTILIPANSLLDAQGVAITTKTNIQFKECYSLADIIASNLQTVHNGDILQTQGMIYLAATTPDGNPVSINPVKPIRIEMPVSSPLPGTKIFKGTRDEKGNMNWVTVEELGKKLVPFPIKTIAPRPNFECPPDFGFTQDPDVWKNSHAKYHLTNDDITKYENTLLATREFKARYYSYCAPDLTQIYIANLDKNMWEVDELMVQYFIKDSTKQVNYELSQDPARQNGGKITKAQAEAHQWLVDHAKESGHEMIDIFKKFAAQKLTKIDETLKIDTSKVRALNEAFVAYEALEFGWINCDIFYNDPKAEPTKLFVQTDETPSVVNIIFKDKKVILDGFEDGPNKFRFTQDKERYNKLPKGDTAIILAIGYRDNKITFGSKDIIIGQKEIEDLDLQVITADELKKRLIHYGG